jgi:type IV pilus assembly protein PilQ
MPRKLQRTKGLFVLCLLVGVALWAFPLRAAADAETFRLAEVSDPVLTPAISQVHLADLVVEDAAPLVVSQIAQAEESNQSEMDAANVLGLTAPKKYKGKPISLDFKDIDILDVFVLISEVSGFNVVVDPDVSGRITIRLDNVPWDQALEVILKNQGLGYEVEGNVMRIASMVKLRDENVLKRQMKDAEEAARPLDTRIVYLSYAKADELDPLVRKVLSKRGDVIIDLRTNAMIVVDLPENLDRALALIRELDVRTKQVSINAQVVATTKQFARSLGIRWGGKFVADKWHGNTTGYRFPNNYTINMEQDETTPYAVNLPAGDQLLELKMGNVLDTLRLQAALTAAESEGMTKLISNPRVTTSDNEQASVESGWDIPYKTVTTDGAVSINFISAVLKLSVTPHITNDDYISMNIEVTKNAPDFTNTASTGGAGVPIIRNVASSRILVKDGETIVIGGLNETSHGTSQSRIPYVSKVPILGLLFKNRTKNSTYSDLLYFITPSIIKTTDETVREGEVF